MGVGYVDSALMLSVYWGTVLSVDGRVFVAPSLFQHAPSQVKKSKNFTKIPLNISV